MAGAAASMKSLLVLPSVPHADEPLNNEYQMIELYMLNKIPSDQINNSYRNVALENLLPSLPHGLTNRPNLEIILERAFFGAVPAVLHAAKVTRGSGRRDPHRATRVGARP